MSKNEKKSCVLYHSFANQFALLSMEERGQLISAIFAYERTGALDAELSPLVNMAFSCMKESLDRDRESYEAKCKQNAKNGKKGGRPKKDISLPKTERLFDEPEKADNDNDNDNENDNDNDNDSDNGDGNEGSSAPKGVRVHTGTGACVCETVTAPLSPPPLSEPSAAPRSVPQLAPLSAPPLTEEDRNLLLSKGIPEGYVKERETRASSYAVQHGKSVYEILLTWWRDDRAKPPWNTSQTRHQPPSESRALEDDDFWQAALARSFREQGIRCG